MRPRRRSSEPGLLPLENRSSNDPEVRRFARCNRSPQYKSEVSMESKVNFLIVACACALFCAIARDEAAAQGITVSPANALIPVGRTQQFTVPEVSNAAGVAAGDYHVCAVLQNGEARCWGNNSAGQLGNGTLMDSSTPVAVSQVTQATSITTGGFHSCAVLRNGSIVCWGRNDLGQLGNGTTTGSATAVTVTGITTARTVAAG